MEPLGDTYRANGSEYKILKRIGQVCIAEEMNTEYPQYEVFIVQHQKGGAKLPGGGITKAKELVPSNSQWGLYGWSRPSTFKDKSWQKFRELVELQA